MSKTIVPIIPDVSRRVTTLSSRFPFIRREFVELMAERGEKMPGFWESRYSPYDKDGKLKPQSIADYYNWYETDGVVYAAINSLAEMAVGQGCYTTVDSDQSAKKLVDEFNQVQNVDILFPNICRNMLIAGFLPVESKLNKFPSKSTLRIIHPLTVVGGELDVDKETGDLLGVTQDKTGTGTSKYPMIPEKDIALFVHNQLGNDYRGNSMIRPVIALLAYRKAAVVAMNTILEKYASPKGIWKSTKDITVLRRVVEGAEAGEDLFLGKLSEGEIKDIVQYIQLDPRVRFWEYIEYIDRLIYEGLMAPSLGYWRQATQASAEVLKEIVDRQVHAIQRGVKRVVEDRWYAPLCKLNNTTEVPKLEFGMPRTGIEDLDLSQFLTTGLEVGYISQGQYLKVLQNAGIRIEPDTGEPSGAATVPGADDEENPKEEPTEGPVPKKEPDKPEDEE